MSLISPEETTPILAVPGPPIPESWYELVKDELDKPYFADLQKFVQLERSRGAVFPPEPDVYNALRVTSPARCRVVILGQDPYHGPGQAHGLSFSVQPGIKPPASLVNIFKELKDDVECTPPGHGCLTSWARQGVLLLNTVLTVRAHQAGSHANHGWEKFTDAVLKQINLLDRRVVFILWGNSARSKSRLIDLERHTILPSAHPSPLSAHNGFFGSKPFSKTNEALIAAGEEPIVWQLPPL